MKKRLYLFLLAAIALFSSCRDESGEFVEQLFTNNEITGALRECFRIATDSTNNTLCIVDTIDFKYGFSHYADSIYRLFLPPAAKPVIDTLMAYDSIYYKAQIDTLIFNLNEAAEKCGNKIKQFWTDVIKELYFTNPNAVLHGGNGALTKYVKEKKQVEFLVELETAVYLEQLNVLQVIQTWNGLQQKYFEITGNYSSIDIVTSATQQMVNGYFDHVTIIENAIRKDPKLRGSSNGLLYKVFATLRP